jgi:hypothetical protein
MRWGRRGKGGVSGLDGNRGLRWLTGCGSARLGLTQQPSGYTLGRQCFDDGVPSTLERLDAFLELLVLPLPCSFPFSAEVVLHGVREGNWKRQRRGRGEDRLRLGWNSGCCDWSHARP